MYLGGLINMDTSLKQLVIMFDTFDFTKDIVA